MRHQLHIMPRGVRVIDGITLQITEPACAGGGHAFAVYRLDTGEQLTVDGWVEQPPTDTDLTGLLDDARGLWRCACGHRLGSADTARIDDHLRDCPTPARR